MLIAVVAECASRAEWNSDQTVPRTNSEALRGERGTIYRDIRQGKLSAEHNGKGRTVVDLSELERVYKRKREGEVSHIVPRGQSDTSDSVRETSVLRREVELLRQQIAGHVSVIDDLRSERDRLLRLLEEQTNSVKLLTDKRMRQKHLLRWWPWRHP